MICAHNHIFPFLFVFSLGLLLSPHNLHYHRLFLRLLFGFLILVVLG